MLLSLIPIIKTRGPGPPGLATVPRAGVASVARLLLAVQGKGVLWPVWWLSRNLITGQMDILMGLPFKNMNVKL